MLEPLECVFVRFCLHVCMCCLFYLKSIIYQDSFIGNTTALWNVCLYRLIDKSIAVLHLVY